MMEAAELLGRWVEYRDRNRATRIGKVLKVISANELTVGRWNPYVENRKDGDKIIKVVTGRWDSKERVRIENLLRWTKGTKMRPIEEAEA